jgi:predicted RNA-binding Zn ribbon-like protein
VSGTEFVANALCLDFANTVNKRPNPDRDRLDSVDNLLRWAQDAGLPTVPQPSRHARSGLTTARHLREAIYSAFSAIASADKPPPTDISLVMRSYADAVAAANLHRDDSRFTLRWPPPLTVPQILWPVATSAAQLLLLGPLDRIGSCPSCGWLFLDTSRNGQRRWCSMAVCGGRMKARRHYANRIETDSGAAPRVTPATAD